MEGAVPEGLPWRQRRGERPLQCEHQPPGAQARSGLRSGMIFHTPTARKFKLGQLGGGGGSKPGPKASIQWLGLSWDPAGGRGQCQRRPPLQQAAHSGAGTHPPGREARGPKDRCGRVGAGQRSAGGARRELLCPGWVCVPLGLPSGTEGRPPTPRAIARPWARPAQLRGPPPTWESWAAGLLPEPPPGGQQLAATR